MQAWSEFYAVIAGTAATLVGLLFVAISVNAVAILGSGQPHSKRLAEQAFQNYVAVLLVALLALFPGIALHQFGQAILGITAVWALLVLLRVFLAFTRPQQSESLVRAARRYIGSLVGFALLIYGAARMAFGGDERNTIAIAAMVLLGTATLAAWEILKRIARDKEAGAG